jgi:predicted ATP-grasp superfamily ATP-dependent carboligase
MHSAAQDAGLTAASLWASVPHYVAAAPNPKAALALVRTFEGLVGVSVDASSLEQAASEYERQVDRAVRADPDVQAFVERLERAAAERDDDEEPVDPSTLPSGDVIAREFQRFLRQRGSE